MKFTAIRKRGPLWLLLMGAATGLGCVGHILPYTPKVRSYVVDDYAQPPAATAPGSLYVDGAAWLSDPRARGVGDIITVSVEEDNSGTHQATTTLSKGTSFDAGIAALFSLTGALSKAVPGLDPSKLISAATNSNHQGTGVTSRQGNVTATLPVRVKKLLPNGDFYVEGSKAVLVNSEEHHLYLSGVVRGIDILADNTIPSNRIDDLQIELTGRGVVTEKQNPGWASRILDYVWPF